MSPFTHQFGHSVALLPAMEPVLHLFLFLASIGGLRFLTTRTGAQLVLEGNQNLGNMIIELSATESMRSGQLRIRSDRDMPSMQDHFAPGGQMLSEHMQLRIIGVCGPVRIPLPTYSHILRPVAYGASRDLTLFDVVVVMVSLVCDDSPPFAAVPVPRTISFQRCPLLLFDDPLAMG